MKNGTFIISVDFELYWGYLGFTDYNECVDRFYLTRSVASRMIEVFEKHEMKVTWATVGLLMLENKKELSEMTPRILKPKYSRREIDNYYNYENLLKEKNFCEGVFFAGDIVEELKNSDYQTIGTHTFSHYLCLEDGQSEDEFTKDMELAMEVSDKKGIEIESIVFPRNQFNPGHLEIIKKYDINIFRGTPDHFIYKPRSTHNYFIRGLRLVDLYFNITGNHTHPHPDSDEEMFDIKASRFLRPLNRTNKVSRGLQLRRIKNEMTKAAENNHYYHLWWHPHNFSASPEENFQFLEEIIAHFKTLEEKYGFSSESMESYVEKVRA
ncbi:polysaccharide deacetylase family protein [Salinicoccus hispanicus]|uniref:Polysaccharide deacetylase family protein n=1 Tax=Salinicoccus hispanicus TaxID=157225 RepID=A0A6N8TZT6_9STAP|nr:polysaccharide deacetylase family protein [Salinicoccus hispanicus]MXQ50992.1 polysaccharide deacetylase family protein [Salinicoccus hispanicus]